MKVIKECANCVYFVMDRDEEGTGQCRIYPPRKMDEDEYGIFPKVFHDDFCGQGIFRTEGDSRLRGFFE